MTQVCQSGLLVLLSVYSVNSHCTRYGICNNFQYVPAPPGHTPSCAKPGSTFCEVVDHYPRQLIRYLIEKWGYDYNTLLSDETKDSFEERKPSVPISQTSYGHHPTTGFAPVSSPIIIPAISYGPFNITTQLLQQGGYPDRTYNIEPHLLTNALQQTAEFNSDARYQFKSERIGYTSPILHPNFQSVQWWKRYKRSAGEAKRKKRQSPFPISSSLCPTRATYIMPRAALNTRGNWMYTVNLNEVDDRYTQLVRSETCISSRCSGLCTLPNGYSSRCQQQFVQKRLVALEGNGERLYSDVFWFPHCCVCQITPN